MQCCVIVYFLQQLSVNILQKHNKPLYNDSHAQKRHTWQADISRIILVYKLPLQPAMLGLGLGLKTDIFGLGLGFQAQVLGLAPCCLLNITEY